MVELGILVRLSAQNITTVEAKTMLQSNKFYSYSLFSVLMAAGIANFVILITGMG